MFWPQNGRQNGVLSAEWPPEPSFERKMATRTELLPQNGHQIEVFGHPRSKNTAKHGRAPYPGASGGPRAGQKHRKTRAGPLSRGARQSGKKLPNPMPNPMPNPKPLALLFTQHPWNRGPLRLLNLRPQTRDCITLLASWGRGVTAPLCPLTGGPISCLYRYPASRSRSRSRSPPLPRDQVRFRGTIVLSHNKRHSTQ